MILSTASLMVQAIAVSQPPPSAWPLAAAITGLLHAVLIEQLDQLGEVGQ
jgi:hypothetical protein